MADIRNLHWFGLNEGRAYPLDDTATQLSDDGDRLPPDLLADLQLRWPSDYGAYAFVSGITVSSTVATVTLLASDSPTAAVSLVPLGVLTVPLPLVPGRMYPIRAQMPGVGGWLVFGHGAARGAAYSGRFATPAQTRITARAGRAYRELPIPGIQAENAKDWLSGVVTLKAQAPLHLTKEERQIAGVNRDCIVVRLGDTDNGGTFPSSDEANRLSLLKRDSVFYAFAGPCAGRPEANTCGCPEPIQFINSVAPDCTGAITIEFQGCTQVASISEDFGVAVACGLGLVDACLPAQLPSSEGLLPTEYEPANIPIPPDIPPEPSTGLSDSLVLGDLPYTECFLGGESTLTQVIGVWEFNTDGGPGPCPLFEMSESLSLSGSFSSPSSGSFQPTTVARRNIAIFDVDVSSVYRKAYTEVSMPVDAIGARRNAQLIINYRPHATLAGQYVYYAAELNYDTQEFRLLRFNGSSFSSVAPAINLTPGIQLDEWYRITATCVPSGGTGDVSITISVQSVSSPGSMDISLSAVVSNYQPSTGKFGVGTNRAIAKFGFLRIEEYLG